MAKASILMGPSGALDPRLLQYSLEFVAPFRRLDRCALAFGHAIVSCMWGEGNYG